MEADVPPLDATFIESFSQKSANFSFYCSKTSSNVHQLHGTVCLGAGKVDELIAGVGSGDRMGAVKATSTCVGMGFLKEDREEPTHHEDREYALFF